MTGVSNQASLNARSSRPVCQAALNPAFLALGVGLSVMGCGYRSPLLSTDPPRNESPVDRDRLQKSCEEKASAWFGLNFPAGVAPMPDGIVRATYQVRYGAENGDCYLAIAGSLQTAVSSDGTGHGNIRLLIEAGSGHIVGQYVESSESRRPTVCFVLQKKCRSMREWSALTGT